MPLSLKERKYYERRLKQELRLAHEDKRSIRKLTAESFGHLLEYLAIRLHLAIDEVSRLIDEFLNSFGWFF